MNTLILTEHFLPAKGGSINWLINTYSRYKPDNIIFVASSCKGDKRVDNELPFRVKRISMPTTKNCDPTIPTVLLRYIQAIWRIHKICRNNDIQQIHCAKVLPEGLMAWCINLLDSIPFIVYAHGEEITAGLTSLKYRLMQPKIYNGAAAIIANSQNTKKLLEKIGVNLKKINIIHPGVNTKLFNISSDNPKAQFIQKKYGLENFKVLLTVSRLEKQKGHDMVIKALPIIKKKFPHIKYIIVGRGSELNNLRNLAIDQNVINDIIFCGLVKDIELPAYYSVCDIFIMANRQFGPNIEGFGMVFLEASAAGKPVIGGLNGGTYDAILDGITGKRVDGNNVKEIAKAVIDILGDSAMSKSMGDAGRNRVKEFSWKSVVQQTHSLSSMVLKNN